MPSDLNDALLWRRVTLYQFLYSTMGLLAGLAFAVGGIVLFFRGVTGATSWTAEFLGGRSAIIDAAPGTVLFIVGLFTVFITRFKVKAHRPAAASDAGSATSC